MSVSFFVPGIPQPKGSARSYVSKRGRLSTVQDNRGKLEPWQAAVGWRAKAQGLRPVRGAVSVSAGFRFPRPKGHYGKRGLRPSAPAHHTVKPDLDKLSRAILDGLTGIAFVDDSQVVILDVRKEWAAEECEAGAWITVGGME